MIFRQPANQPKEITNASGTSDCKIKFINERLSEYRRVASLLRVDSKCSIDSRESQVTFLNNITRATLSVKIGCWGAVPESFRGVTVCLLLLALGDQAT